MAVGQMLRNRSGPLLRYISAAAVASTSASKTSSSLWRPQLTSTVQSGSYDFYRSFDGLDIGRGFATRAKRVDVGARARQLQARRLWTIALSGTAVAGFIVVVLNTFQENITFYVTPTQALDKFFLDPSKNRFRLGGLVLEGSVERLKNSTEMEFVVTDLANEILVKYRGSVPDLFREGHSVVAEGLIRPLDQYPGDVTASGDQHTSITAKARESNCYFAAIEVLAKHDEKYMPKEVAVAVAKNRAMLEAREAPALLTTTVQAEATTGPPSSGEGPKKKGIAQTPTVAKSYEING